MCKASDLSSAPPSAAKNITLCCKAHKAHSAETSENVQLLIRKAEGGPDALKFTLMLVLFYTRKKNLTEKY